MSLRTCKFQSLSEEAAAIDAKAHAWRIQSKALQTADRKRSMFLSLLVVQAIKKATEIRVKMH